MAMKKQEPEADWVVYKVRLIKAYDTYNNARKKLPRAEITSDLSSCDEKKRIPVKRKVYIEDDNIKNYTTKHRKIVATPTASNLVLPDPPAIQIPMYSETCLNLQGVERNEYEILNYDNSNLVSSQLITVESMPNPCGIKLTLEEEAQTEGATVDTFLEGIRKDIFSLKTQCTEINRKLDWVMAVLQNQPNTSSGSVNELSNEILSSPFDNLETLMEFDFKLASDTSFRALVKQAFWLIGGKTSGVAVSRMLNKTMTNKLGCAFSLLGKRGNHSLKKLVLYNVLLESLKMHCWAKSVTGNDIDDGIKSWLRHCKSRLQSEKQSKSTDGSPENENGGSNMYWANEGSNAPVNVIL